MREYFLTICLIAAAAIGAGIIAYSFIGAKSGEVVAAFSSTDDLPEGVRDITVSISDVSLIDDAGAKHLVASDSQEYSLAELAGAGLSRVLARGRSGGGDYRAIAITLDSIVVTEVSGSVAEAVMPTRELVVPAQTSVAKGKTATIVIDLSGERTVRQSRDGVWVALPVLRIETRADATAVGMPGETLQIASGTVVANATFGTSPDGSIRENFALPASMTLTVGEDGSIDASAAAPEPVFELPEPEPAPVEARGATTTPALR